MMQTSPTSIQAAKVTAASGSQLISTHMGWQIFLSRVSKPGSGKGLWLHWYHPFDQGRKDAVRYGYFIAPNQTLEEALYAAHQSIEAIVELESIDQLQFGFAVSNHREHCWQAVAV